MISKDELRSVEPKKRLVAFRGIARYVIEKISEAEDFSGHMLDDLESIIDGMVENYAEYHYIAYKFLMQSDYVSASK